MCPISGRERELLTALGERTRQSADAHPGLGTDFRPRRIPISCRAGSELTVVPPSPPTQRVCE